MLYEKYVRESVIRPVKRVLPGTSLLTTGCLVERIDGEIPNLYSCLCKILMPQMIQSEWDKLTEGMKLSKRIQKGTCIFILSEKAYNYYNCLISNVNTVGEKSSKMRLLYTDDNDFDVYRLPKITNDRQFNDIKNGVMTFIKPNNTYVIKTTTEFISGPNHNHKETVTDIAFYIPRDSLFVGDR